MMLCVSMALSLNPPIRVRIGGLRLNGEAGGKLPSPRCGGGQVGGGPPGAAFTEIQG